MTTAFMSDSISVGWATPVGLRTAILLGCLLASGFGVDTVMGMETRPPNVVLIMADDLGIEAIGCYGGESYATPHLDRLAADGMRFTRAYSQPLCTPTRVQLMTGRYNHRNWRCFGILDPAAKTFGHLMQEAGYQTCIAGKWQLYSYDPPGYPGAESRRGIGMHPKDAGFHEYQLFHSLHTEDKGSRYANPTFLRNGELHQNLEGTYGEDHHVAYIVDFMRRHREQPMFIYYPMSLPHWPFNPTPQSQAWKDPSRRLEESTEHFGDMVAYMDWLVGRVVREVDDLGLADNTVVLFYSDNGTDRRITSRFRGQDVQGGKAETTQSGIRVPLIARWPGTIEPGQVNDDLIDASDFLPTFAELSGAANSRFRDPGGWGVEGQSFAGALLGMPHNPRDWCYFWYDPRPGWDKEGRSRFIFALDQRYKLFSDGRFFEIESEAMGEEPLQDPLTMDAVEARTKLQRVLNEMMAPPLSEAALTDPDEFGKP